MPHQSEASGPLTPTPSRFYLQGPLLTSYYQKQNLALQKKISLTLHIDFTSMEETLAFLWDSLSLSESETTTLVINHSKLSTPDNAIVGRLAMRKFVSLVEIERGLKII